MSRQYLRLACAAALAVSVHAQAPAGKEAGPVLEEQITPFSVWLDFRVLAQPNPPKPALPIWFESFQTQATPAKGAQPPLTTYRLRLRRMPSLHHELMLRLYFDDLPEMQPVVSVWSETGEEKFHSQPLGVGVGLPSQASVVLPLDGADYIDVVVPGNGTTIRGALACSLKEAVTRQTNDFNPAGVVIDPFGAVGMIPDPVDRKLYGRVKALLDPEPVRLSQADGTAFTWEFRLQVQPLVTVVTFEVLNADLSAPPVVFANDSAPVFASVQWPDLADPGFRGEARPLEPALRFQYTGWLKAQAVIPGDQLHEGLNRITVGLSENSGPIAVRNVELQVKENWKHFDYILSPVNP